MMKLEGFSLLFAVLTVAAAQYPRPGPFHSAVDDFGQVYYATQSDPTLPIALGPYQTFFTSVPLPRIPGESTDSASAIIFVASNSGRYTNWNPAGIIFSSDPPTLSSPPFIVSDSSWYCKGYGPQEGVNQADWPKKANAESLITAALNNEEYKNWPKAVELFFGGDTNNLVVENIPLQAKYIWAADAEPGYPENPPRNVICIKSIP